MAVDGQGKFLFVAGPASIAMYAIDAASGALTEVPSSPIPYIPTINRTRRLPIPSPSQRNPPGQYVYVGFQNAITSLHPTTYSSITPYVIDTSNPPIPRSISVRSWNWIYELRADESFRRPYGPPSLRGAGEFWRQSLLGI